MPKVKFEVELVAMSEHRPGWKEGTKLHKSETVIHHLTLKLPDGKAHTFIASKQAIEAVTRLAAQIMQGEQHRAKQKGK